MLTQSQMKYESQTQGTLNDMLDKMQQMAIKQLPTIYHVYMQLVNDIVQKAKVIQTNWHLICKLGYERYFMLVNRLGTIIEGVCSNFLLLRIQDYLAKEQIPLDDLSNYLEACHVSNKHMVEMLCEYLIVADHIFGKIVDQSQSDKMEFQRSILIDKVQLAAVKSLKCKSKTDDILLKEGRHSLSPILENNRHPQAQVHYKKYHESMKEFGKLKEALKVSTFSLEKSLQHI